MRQAVLLIQCPDQTGIIAKLSQFVFDHHANITNSDQYSSDPDGGRFFMRLEFCWKEESLSPEQLEEDFRPLGESLGGSWDLHYDAEPLRMAVVVSKYDHCLLDLMYRVKIGELPVQIPCVISNHNDLREIVEQNDIPFHHLPVNKDTRPDQEAQILKLISDSSDFMVMARYMQILSNDFLASYGKDVINIHHSFLPSFKGANPYRKAYERGVKVIGATAHFASVDLDEGPIIAQMVDRVSHKDDVEALKRKGRSLEQMALAQALHQYTDHRVIRFEHKTIVFD